MAQRVQFYAKAKAIVPALTYFLNHIRPVLHKVSQLSVKDNVIETFISVLKWRPQSSVNTAAQ